MSDFSIEKFDENFDMNKVKREENVDVYSLPCAPFDLYGVYYDEREQRFMRMPSEVAKEVSEGVSGQTYFTAGGRIRFATDSSTIEIRVTFPHILRMSHMTIYGQSGFALVEDCDGESERVVYKGMFAPAWNEEKGFNRVIEVGEGGTRYYTLHFPSYGEVTSLEIAVKSGSKVTGGKKYRDIKPILYYGSSITEGGCASRPDTIYQAIIQKWNDIDFINLGFSGNAKGERAMAEYLSTIDCSLFVCDYDHNAPTVEHLRKTHYPLYKAFREKNPQTPVLFISKPDYGNDWGGETSDQRIAVIKRTYLRAKKEGDKNVYFLHGKLLFGKEDRSLCTVDKCHPTDLGFYRMAQTIYKKMQKISKEFK